MQCSADPSGCSPASGASSLQVCINTALDVPPTARAVERALPLHWCCLTTRISASQAGHASTYIAWHHMICALAAALDTPEHIEADVLGAAGWAGALIFAAACARLACLSDGIMHIGYLTQLLTLCCAAVWAVALIFAMACARLASFANSYGLIPALLAVPVVYMLAALAFSGKLADHLLLLVSIRQKELTGCERLPHLSTA